MRLTLGRFASTTLAGRDLAVPDDLDGPTQMRTDTVWSAVLRTAEGTAVRRCPVR